MVCATAILSSSLALSLLRHSSTPSESFVLSPFSLNSVLAIIHDGAGGETQKELTNLLLNGCSPSDVTAFYSSLALSLPSTNESGVAFKSANRFYVDDSIALKEDYQQHVEEKYKAKVQNTKLSNKVEAAAEMNKFVEEATNGKIKDVIAADRINDYAKAILINAVNFVGKWKFPFNAEQTYELDFNGTTGIRTVEFLTAYDRKFRINVRNDVGPALIMPYLDEKYSFFYLMPYANSSLEKMRNELTGEKLVNVLHGAIADGVDVTIPKIKVESKLDGAEVLSKMGVKNLFTNGADLSKISSTLLQISKTSHHAVIRVDENGTEAGAETDIESVNKMSRPNIRMDRPFIYGILRGDDILFLGQFV